MKNITSILVAATCFMIIILAIVAVPKMLNSADPDIPGTTINPGGNNIDEADENYIDSDNEDIGEIKIDDLSKFVYYASRKMIIDSGNSSGNMSASVSPDAQFKLMKIQSNAAGIINLSGGKSDSDVTSSATKSSTTGVIKPDSGTTAVKDDKKIYYYDINSITITRVIYFQFVLDDKDCFLASKIGTGTIEAVIAEIKNVDKMITFKNGNKYYSCLQNSGSWSNGVGVLEFSTHKIISGFQIIKNFEQDNFQFYVGMNMDGGLNGISKNVISFEYSYIDTMGKMNKPHDGKCSVVPDKFYNVDMSATFSPDELENYFNKVFVK